MSKYGGSEKTTQAFVAAYNKPRLLIHSTQVVAPAGVLLCSGRTSPLPHFSLSSLASSSPGVMWGGGLVGRTIFAGCFTGPVSPQQPLTGLHHPLPAFVAPTNQALCALWPHLLHKNNMQFYDVHWHLCPSSCSQTQAQNKTFPGVVNVLMMWRPGVGSMHTLKHGSWW